MTEGKVLLLTGADFGALQVQGLLARFASQAGLWQRAVKGMAELDALMALGYAAQFGGEGAPMCRPTFVEPQTPGNGRPTGHVSKLLAHCVNLQCLTG